MTRIALTLAGGLVLGGLGIGAASAAPAMPAPGIVGGDAPLVEVSHHRRHWRHHHRAMRHHSMRGKMFHGDPNSRNPSQPGIAQRKGTTSGGPRF
ncbi:hypothetical protein [Methylobacterium sp. sgz302541]|uniref:hypothetical protein n=1 Tax=unclassified Methylobacterium TaxID=2615210 RepID=UPI003D330F2F